MARLETARRIASGKPPPPVDLPGTASDAAGGPPALNPAHALVAQLEEEEARKNGARASSALTSAEALADAKVSLPSSPPVRPMPEWVWGALLVMLVAVSLSYAYLRATNEQALPYEVEPARIDSDRRSENDDRKLLRLLKKGHEAAIAGQHRQAILNYQAAVALDPNLASAQRGLGIAYAAIEDYASAVRHYERFIDLQPESMEAAKIQELIEAYKRMQR
ncbi:MAG: tetratricopeptide repeat protein [Myxococcota bacterium]